MANSDDYKLKDYQLEDDKLEEYELLDIGGGRKLERFGPMVLDRPSPAAEGFERGEPRIWNGAAARYLRGPGDQGEWIPSGALPATWNVNLAGLTFELRPTPFGHVGLFAEQQENWRWIVRQVLAAGRPLKVLNLFAYTGGSTLAAALAGAEVVHIDAAKNIVAWARRNAELSKLENAPIRWIAEDAQRFVQRELQRGNRYDAVILDPPSYGHGPKGEVWKLDEHLIPLMRDLALLTQGAPAFLLASCHMPSCTASDLTDLVDTVFTPHGATRGGKLEAFVLALHDRRNWPLVLGSCVRWTNLES